MIKEKPEIYYKKYKTNIKKICHTYSQYFKLEYTDLLSLANESFLKSYQRYQYNKVSFKVFMLINLKNTIKRYYVKNKKEKIKQEYYSMLRKNEISIQNETLIVEEYFSYQKIKKNNIKIKQNIKKIINTIIDLCLSPNFREKIKPFCITNTKNNMKNAPKYAISNYLYSKFNYSTYEIEQAFKNIKLMLEGGII